MNRLIVCTDGTWNSKDADKDGGLTNVAKLPALIADADAKGARQITKYHDGVGASGSWWTRMTEGAFGVGLSRNVKDCYKWLIEHYASGDELFFFGFSRGAFTARSLAGLIRNCGVLRPEHIGRIDEVYEFYRDRNDRTHPDSDDAKRLRANYAVTDLTPIQCVGVWDTVGALGVPTAGLIGMYTRRKYGFHDVRLSSSVANGFHALAIDEQRKPFAPTLWVVPDSRVKDPAFKQRVEQVWFPGVHSNVGGGYADAALSNLAFLWMLQRATQSGLALKPGALDALSGDSLGKLYDSFSFMYNVLGRHIRPIRAEQTDPTTGEKLHTFEDIVAYAFDRRKRYRPPGYNPAYDPANLRRFDDPKPAAAPQ